MAKTYIEQDQDTEPVFDVIYRIGTNILAAIGLVSAAGAIGFVLGFMAGGSK